VPPDDDWRLPVDKRASECYQRYDRCEAYAHSLFADLSVLVAARGSVPWARKKSIAQVGLTPDLGRVVESPSVLGASHHDWWPSHTGLVPKAVVIEGSIT
jgi:hypothetical protein